MSKRIWGKGQTNSCLVLLTDFNGRFPVDWNFLILMEIASVSFG